MSPTKKSRTPRPLAAGEVCGCGRATAPDLRELLPGGHVLVHRRRSCSIEVAARDGALLIRLSVEEREALDAAAREAGQGTGPWLRALGMAEARRKREPVRP